MAYTLALPVVPTSESNTMTAQPERSETAGPATNGVAVHEPAATALPGTNDVPQPPAPRCWGSRKWMCC
ncbi:MAG: hypothetical protein MUD01_20490 [Chloroflexaceae bacterium]|nr:hypothetical protein [Chloroflexaceae bacterium]